MCSYASKVYLENYIPVYLRISVRFLSIKFYSILFFQPLPYFRVHGYNLYVSKNCVRILHNACAHTKAQSHILNVNDN